VAAAPAVGANVAVIGRAFTSGTADQVIPYIRAVTQIQG